MSTERLTRRELNHATLARQTLFAREKTSALRAIERLVGLQALSHADRTRLVADELMRFAEDGARTFELRFGRNAPKKVRKKPRKPA